MNSRLNKVLVEEENRIKESASLDLKILEFKKEFVTNNFEAIKDAFKNLVGEEYFKGVIENGDVEKLSYFQFGECLTSLRVQYNEPEFTKARGYNLEIYQFLSDMEMIEFKKEGEKIISEINFTSEGKKIAEKYSALFV